MKLSMFWSVVQVVVYLAIVVSHIGWAMWATIFGWQVLAMLTIYGLQYLSRQP